MAKILIVDDSATMRQIIMRGITQAGFKVQSFEEAGNGLQGLEALQDSNVDLILSDVNMPQMNGIDFVKHVRDTHGDETPIVMMTNEGLDEVMTEAKNNGATSYIKKPFSPEQIRDILGPHLS